MAFMGLVIVGIVILLLIAMLILSLIFLITGICKRHKHKTTSRISIAFAIFFLMIPVCVVIYLISPKGITVETQDGGTVNIKAGWIAEYRECLAEHDIEGLRELFNLHPEMIYYHDANYVTLLDYGMYNMDIELMQIAINHGAIFDDPFLYNHLVFCNSFDSFFARMNCPADNEKTAHRAGETSDEIIETVQFMIDNGASLEYNIQDSSVHQNFYEQAKEWVNADGYLSEKDLKLLNLLQDALQN